MRVTKYISGLLLALALCLAGCGEQLAPTPTATATPTSTVATLMPTSTATATRAPVVDSAEVLSMIPPEADQRIAYGADPQQFGDLRLPEGAGPFPVVVVIHGGYWLEEYDLTYSGFMAEALTEAGMATWNIEYRRIGNQGGGWPGTLQDVAAATDYLRTLAVDIDLDLEHVVAIGHSAGGHLALWLAGRENIDPNSPLYTADPLPLHGVVSLAGVADLVSGAGMRLGSGVINSLLAGSPTQVPDHYAAASPRALLPLGVPQALFHGTDDLIVPFSISEGYAQAATSSGDQAELMPLPGGHFELVDPRTEQWAMVQDKVLQMLR